LIIERLPSSWLSKTSTSEAPRSHPKSEALLSSRGPILASVSPLDPKCSRGASNRFRLPSRPLHTRCVSRYLSILRCATRSERRRRVQRFMNDTHRQLAPGYSRFIAPFFVEATSTHYPITRESFVAVGAILRAEPPTCRLGHSNG